ncbi:hypothetical protein K438DRAFT_2150224, partial [Mycena galopus ATCC 62051]
AGKGNREVKVKEKRRKQEDNALRHATPRRGKAPPTLSYRYTGASQQGGSESRNRNSHAIHHPGTRSIGCESGFSLVLSAQVSIGWAKARKRNGKKGGEERGSYGLRRRTETQEARTASADLASASRIPALPPRPARTHARTRSRKYTRSRPHPHAPAHPVMRCVQAERRVAALVPVHIRTRARLSHPRADGHLHHSSSFGDAEDGGNEKAGRKRPSRKDADAVTELGGKVRRIELEGGRGKGARRSAESCSPLRRSFIDRDRVDTDSEMTENGPARTPPPSKRIHDASVVSVSTCGRVRCKHLPRRVHPCRCWSHSHTHTHTTTALPSPSADRIRALSSVDRDSRPRRYNASVARLRPPCAQSTLPLSLRAFTCPRARALPLPKPCLSRRSLPTPSSPTTEERRGREHTHRPAHPVLALNAAAGHEECSSVDE